MRKIIFALLVASLFALPVVASEGVENESSQESVVYSSEADTDSSALALIAQNQERTNDNIVFCAAALISTLGIVVGYCSGRDLLRDLWG